MKFLVSLILPAILCLVATAKEPWLPRYDTAYERSVKTGLPMLVVISRSLCQACSIQKVECLRMEQELETRLKDRVIPVYLNDPSDEVVRAFRVTAVPTVIVGKAGQVPTFRHEGVVGASELIKLFPPEANAPAAVGDTIDKERKSPLLDWLKKLLNKVKPVKPAPAPKPEPLPLPPKP